MEDVLSYMYLISEWQPEVIERVWNDFTPEKLRVLVMAKQFENELDQVEPWYGTRFKVANIKNETLQVCVSFIIFFMCKFVLYLEMDRGGPQY